MTNKVKASILSTDRTYRSWGHMKARCNNKNYCKYDRYGGRGISYIKHWETYKNFLDDMGKRPDNTSLDRINNDGNYNKQNCRWATSFQQNNNRGSIVIVTWKGKKYSLRELSRAFGLNYSTLVSRYRRSGWSLKKTIETPVDKSVVAGKNVIL